MEVYAHLGFLCRILYVQKNKIDSLWDVFAAGGLVNPLDVIEQIIFAQKRVQRLPKKQK